MVSTEPMPEGDLVFGDLSYYIVPVLCICYEAHEIGEHWFCPAHDWMMRGRMRARIPVSHELAADYGWECPPPKHRS